MQAVHGRTVLWAGNAVFDDLILYTGSNNDREPILTDIDGSVPTNAITAYRSTDINMDGNVIYTGSNNVRDIILSNIGGLAPTNSGPEQLP